MARVINLETVKNYFIAWYRYRLYYSPFRFLIRKHIIEQFEYRLKVVNKECYTKGSCVKCGCHVPALLFSDAPCAGNCYPEFKNKKNWFNYASLLRRIQGKI